MTSPAESSEKLVQIAGRVGSVRHCNVPSTLILAEAELVNFRTHDSRTLLVPLKFTVEVIKNVPPASRALVWVSKIE